MAQTTMSAAPPRQSAGSGAKPHPGLPVVLLMVIFAVIVFPLIVVLGSGYYIWSTAKVHQTQRTDAIVVLGAAQFNGTPSPVLKARLQHALTLYRQGVAPQIITVGGKQAGDLYTEAGAGRQWLIEQGVPAEDVIAIKDGSNTLESLAFVADYARDHGVRSITIDSDPAHMARSKAMANRLGFKVYTNPTSGDDGSQVTDAYLARETLAYLAFEVFEQWDVPRVVDGG